MPRPTPSDINQLETYWLFAHARQVVTPAEVAKVLDISVDHVRDYVDQGLIAAAPIGDQPNQQRQHLRIMRWSVEGFWLNRLESQGITLPIAEPPLVTHWRAHLRKHTTK